MLSLPGIWALHMRVPHSVDSNLVAGKRVTVVGGKPEWRPMVNMTISGTKVTVLVDTGVPRSLLRLETLRRIANCIHRPFLLRETGPLQSVCGSLLDVRSITEVRIDSIKRPIEVVMVNDLPHELILEEDVLRAGNSVISFREREFSWYGKSWPIRQCNYLGFAVVGPVLPATGKRSFERLFMTALTD